MKKQTARNSKFKVRNLNLILGTIGIIALLAYAYYPTIVWMVDRWAAKDSYYGHGFLIPLVSLFWIYKKRDAILKAPKQPTFWTPAFLFSGILLQVTASILRIYFVSAISLVLIIFGLVSLLGGRQVLRQTWFPIGFLFMMVPLPLLMISQITLKMKFFVSEISAHLISQTGIEAVRHGSYIYMPHAVILVGDPCSGLRSFLAFLCLGFIFAYMSRFPLWKRFVLVVAGLPLAIISNVVRVYAMGMIGEIYGMKYTTGVIHDAAGIVVFLIALTGFLIIRSLLEEKHAVA